MSFQFRYQRILDVRELEEDQEQAEFVEIQNRLRDERSTLEDLKEELKNHFDKARSQKRGSPDAIQRHRKYARRLNQKIEEQQKVVKDWEEKLEKQREELVEASQKRQVMERLKEQDFEDFQEEIRDAEQKEQDDISNKQFFRDE